MKVRLHIPILLSEICKFTDGVLKSDDRTVEFLSTNSKKCQSGDLFIALHGEKYDGADFSDEAHSRGAYVMSSRADADLWVSDTGAALLSLANAYKKMLPGLYRTVAVTGSVGKSTTKEFLREILGAKFKVHATEGNLNNLIGLPLTILSAPRDTGVLVLEAGMNARGEISALSKCAEPDTSIITNIGTSHIGMLGTRENIAEAKLEIRSGMKPGASLIVPFFEPLLSGRAELYTGVLCECAELNIIPEKSDKGSSLVSVYSKGEFAFSARLGVGGSHQLYNLSYAIAAAMLLGMSYDEIKLGISRISTDNLRQKITKLDKITLIDDSYNASPESLSAAFSYLSLFAVGTKSALISDVLELGEFGASLHRKIGEDAVRCGVERLYLFGDFAKETAEGARALGMPDERIIVISEGESPKEFAERICTLLEDGETLLAKASHRTAMSDVLAIIKERLKKKNAG